MKPWYIIPENLFIFYSAPYDPNRPWAKQNYEEDFYKNFQFSYTGNFYLYQESWYWYDIKKKIKHYTSILKKICKDEDECKWWIQFYKEFYLSHPELIYEGRWIYHDLH